MQVRRLENVLVLLGDDLVPTPCALFEWSETDGAVVRIEPMTSIPAITSTVVVVPAFYNAHTHVSDGILADAATGLTLEEAVFRPAGLKYRELAKVAPAQLAAAAACTLESMARTGTVVHCDFTEQGVAGVTALRSASAAKPTTTARSIICSQLSLPPFSAEQLKRNAPEDTLPPGTLEELDQLWGRESSGSDGFSENTMNDLTDAAWRALRDLTTNKYPNKLRAIHCLESQVYRTASVEMSADRKGDLVRALELYDPHIIVHLTEADDDEIALLAASGKPGVLCPRANAVLGLSLPPIYKLLKSKAPLLLGSDNVMLNSPNMLAEMDFAYKLAKSQAGNGGSDVDPREILKMATINAAKVFAPFLHRSCGGGLAVGAHADFVVFDFSAPHLQFSRNVAAAIVSRATPADILSTYFSGECLYTRS